jgi:hypothetical protein
VELDDVEVLGLHPRQALFNAGHDALAGEDVRAALPARRWRRDAQFHRPMAQGRDRLFGRP